MSQIPSGNFESENISLEKGANPVGDVIFLPTDDLGTPGRLNTRILNQLGLEESTIPKPNALRDGYAIVDSQKQRICFIVTVGVGATADLLSRNLRAALSDKRLSSANELWIPLMGAGAGNLSLDESNEIILIALAVTGWRNRSDAHVTIAWPPDARESENSAQLPQDPAMEGAIRFAAALADGRRQRGNQISTTLLFFALAESQAKTAPQELINDRSASLFSGAVHSLAGERFGDAWEAYFVPGFVASSSSPPPSSSQFTDNVAAIIEKAASLAQEAKRSHIGTDELIASLLSYSKGRHIAVIKTMGLSMPELLREYRDAVTGQIGTTLLNDVAAEEDRLGYESYAQAIKDFLVNAATPPPLSVSIQAPWGAGKSSLMQQIRNKLDPRKEREKNKRTETTEAGSRLKLRDVLAFLNQTRKRKNETREEKNPGELWTVWFNAWKYDTSEQVWAGLVDAIVTQVSERLKPVDRELFLLRLQLARIDDGVVRRKIYDRIMTIWWDKVRTLLLAGAGLIASLLGIHKIVPDHALDPTMLKALQLSPVAAAIALSSYFVINYFWTREKTKSEPASFSLAQYLNVPDYNQSLGTIHHIHKDLLRVLSVTPREPGKDISSPIVIFIDDLDRCSPSSVADVVEGVSMFLASEDYRCMFVIGMDPQLIAAALENAHAKVREQLPRYERTVPLGWRFMDKFIQLPFTIPPSNSVTLKGYVDWLSGAVAANEDLPVEDEPLDEKHDIPAPAPNPRDRKNPAGDNPAHVNADGVSVAVTKFNESRDVGSIIREAANMTSGNPREIKRLANLARLYLGLRDTARSRNSLWRSPSLGQYARWITLTLRWPDMMRWLQWGADEGTWATEETSMGLLVRRLRFLEDSTFKAHTSKEWAEALAGTLNVPSSKPSDWACDPKLFEFFREEEQRPLSERISEAAARGFW